MKRIGLFLFFFFFCAKAWSITEYKLAYRFGGSAEMMMTDGKVDVWIQLPVLGGQFAVEKLSTGRWNSIKKRNKNKIDEEER